MKIKYVWGAAGTGKSYFLAKYLLEKEEQYPSLNFLITSYTHLGKDELYGYYLYFKGDKTTPYRRLNSKRHKTFHSIVYNVLKENFKEFNKKLNLLYFIEKSKKNEKNESFSFNDVVRMLFFPETSNEVLVKENLAKLSKILDLKLNNNIVRRILRVKSLLEREEEDFGTLMKIKEEILKLRKKELISLLLLVEGNLYDYGKIYDPISQKVVDDKIDYVITKYKAIFGIDYIEDELRDVVKYVIEEEFSAPLHPIYNMRKLFDIAIQEERSIVGDFYDVIIIDESQDYPEVAFYFLKNFFDYGELIVAGDPYQSIYLDLGFNSEFCKKRDDFLEIRDVMFRFSEGYFEHLERKLENFNKIMTLSSIKRFMGTTETEFEELNIRVPSYVKSKTRYLGKKIIDLIKNRTDCVLLVHNLSTFVGVSDVVFLPYWKIGNKKGIYRITEYMLGKYFFFKEKGKGGEEEIIKKLREYYEKELGFFEIMQKIRTHPFIEERKELKEELGKYSINELTLEKLYDVLKKYPNIFNKFFKIGEKDFVITLTTHSSKGLTIKETIYYIPNKGKYLFLEKMDKKYYFIHNLMKYVSLTRARNKLVYVSRK